MIVFTTMGIKGLKQFLRQKFNTCIHKSTLAEFYGQKAALDLLPYLYKYKVGYGDKWRHGLYYLFTTFIKYNIHLSVIMDGPTAVKEKDKEREKRKAGRDRIQTKIEAWEQDLEHFKTTRESTPLISSLYKNQHKSLINGTETVPVVSEADISKQIQKYRQQIVSISKEDMIVIQELCDSLSIPFYIAQQEAESFSTYLCKTNQVQLVVTEDSDVLAYGCPRWISGVKTDGTCDSVHISELLTEMKFTMDQFLDFCILCGTDFNETIKGVGTVSAYKAIQDHGNIEAFLTFRHHETLQEETVRAIFKNPCSNAIEGRDNPVIKKFEGKFNPFQRISLVKKLYKLYPIQSFIQWICSYQDRFSLED